MYRPRVIPTLLLDDDGIVKSVKFKNHKYIGDPINAVKIFNDLKADEITFLDINATKKNRLISLDFVKKVGEEANMPFAVGGGIKSISDIKKILACGAEKVIIGSEAANNPSFIKEASLFFGKSTISVCIDVKKDWLGREYVYFSNGNSKTKLNPIAFAMKMQDLGVGELIIQSIDRDGVMQGYDVELIKKITHKTLIPITALGGAGNLNDMKSLYAETFVNGLAAGSLFVYFKSTDGILINYPNQEIINDLFL